MLFHYLETICLISIAINTFERKRSRKGVVKEGKVFTLFISNEDMNDIIKVKKSLEDSGVLIDEVTETVKDKIKKQKGWFLGALLAPLVASLVEPVISPILKCISETGVRRAGRGHANKNFRFLFILKVILRLLIISIMNLDLMAFSQETVCQE